MSLAFQRVGKCGQSEREFLMHEIETVRAELIAQRAENIRQKHDIKRLKVKLWAAGRENDRSRP